MSSSITHVACLGWQKVLVGDNYIDSSVIQVSICKLNEYIKPDYRYPAQKGALDNFLTDEEWESSLTFILKCADLRQASLLLNNYQWQKWAESPARLEHSPGDDPVPGLGLSRYWLNHKSRHKLPAYWHDLMYRDIPVPTESRLKVDTRFYELCMLPEFARNKIGEWESSAWYGIVRAVGGRRYKGPA